MFPIYHIIILVKEKGWVEPNESQRRAGIFTEKTGCISVKGYGKLSPMKGGGNYTDRLMVVDGFVNRSFDREGGIFMGSSVKNSYLWNCKVGQKVKDGIDIIDKYGSCEHLKEFLPRDGKIEMEANTLYWITDRTPQEWLHLRKKHIVSFLRLYQIMFLSGLLIIPQPTLTAFCQTRMSLKLSREVI